MFTLRLDQNINANNLVWYRFQADTGLQAAYTDPINPLFNATVAAAAVLVRVGLHARRQRSSREPFQPVVLVVLEHLPAVESRARRCPRFPIVLQGQGPNVPFTHGGRSRQLVAAGSQGDAGAGGRRCDLDHGSPRVAVRRKRPLAPLRRLRFRRGDHAGRHLHDAAAIHLRRRLDGDARLSRRAGHDLQRGQHRRVRAGFGQALGSHDLDDRAAHGVDVQPVQSVVRPRAPRRAPSIRSATT